MILLKLLSFVDETSLAASDKKIDDLLLRTNSELLLIYDWLCGDELTLNLKKIKYLIFQPRQKVNYNVLLSLTLAGQYLQQVSSLKYLGIYIDDHLSWHDHIVFICDKSINIMIEVKGYLGNQSKGMQNPKKAFSLGNLANACEMPVSKQLMPFHLVDQA